MPICSYVVIPEKGRGGELAERLARLPGCQVTRSSNRELLLLVTDTSHAGEEAALREALNDLAGVEQLLLSFGELGSDETRAASRVTGIARALPVVAAT